MYKLFLFFFYDEGVYKNYDLCAQSKGQILLDKEQEDSNIFYTDLDLIIHVYCKHLSNYQSLLY